jgi:GT2 family glycosyltransferase
MYRWIKRDAKMSHANFCRQVESKPQFSMFILAIQRAGGLIINHPHLLSIINKIPLLDRAIRFFLKFLLQRDFKIESEIFHLLLDATPFFLLGFKRPQMTILLPVYNTDPKTLAQCLDSVLNQFYKKWELCIVDDASSRPHIRQILLDYAQKDHRIKLTFSETNQGIAETINKAARMASGDYLGVLDHDDELEPLTLFEYVKMITEHPDAECIYCDEDKIDEAGTRCDFWFKSDWNPDLSLSFNYVMHFAMFRRILFEQIGGVRKAYEGSQDYDLLLRISEKTDKIYHIPKILYHWRKGPGSIAGGPDAKPRVFVSGLAALNQALKRRGIEGEGVDAPDAWKGVYRVKRRVMKPLFCSVIIAYKGNPGCFSRLMQSIFSHFPREGREIIVCASPDIDIPSPYDREVRWITGDEKSLPEMFNAGAKHANGDLLLFLDETLEILSSECYVSLLEHAQREEVGAVGGKIYYGNGLIEHTGIILGPFNFLGYAHKATGGDLNYAGLKNMICNYSAVMGLGMMTRKQVFWDMGGLDARFKEMCWDADYCLRLREKGYLITYTPYAAMAHHIPIKSTFDMIEEPEASLFRNRWQKYIDRDPFFNPNFIREHESFGVDYTLLKN